MSITRPRKRSSETAETARRPRVLVTVLPAAHGLAEARDAYRRAAFARAMEELFEDRDVTRGR